MKNGMRFRWRSNAKPTSSRLHFGAGRFGSLRTRLEQTGFIGHPVVVVHDPETEHGHPVVEPWKLSAIKLDRHIAYSDRQDVIAVCEPIYDPAPVLLRAADGGRARRCGRTGAHVLFLPNAVTADLEGFLAILTPRHDPEAPTRAHQMPGLLAFLTSLARRTMRVSRRTVAYCVCPIRSGNGLSSVHATSAT